MDIAKLAGLVADLHTQTLTRAPEGADVEAYLHINLDGKLELESEKDVRLSVRISTSPTPQVIGLLRDDRTPRRRPPLFPRYGIMPVMHHELAKAKAVKLLAEADLLRAQVAAMRGASASNCNCDPVVQCEVTASPSADPVADAAATLHAELSDLRERRRALVDRIARFLLDNDKPAFAGKLLSMTDPIYVEPWHELKSMSQSR